MEIVHLRLLLILCVGVHRSSSDVVVQQGSSSDILVQQTSSSETVKQHSSSSESVKQQSSSKDIVVQQNTNGVTFNIDEGYKGTFPYILGTIDIRKKFPFFKISGQGINLEPKDILSINQSTGEVSVHGPVDYEQYRVLKVTYQACEKETYEVDTQLDVQIMIIDANDNPPKFDKIFYEISIAESTVQGTTLVTFTAHDDDVTENNKLFDFKIVSVIPQTSEMEFYLTQVSQTGTISFKGCLDYEKAEKYTIIVEAKDRGEKTQLSSTATVVINIKNGNNHLPQITGQTGPGRVKERMENVLVSRLQVTDNDRKFTAAWRAKYQIQGDLNNNFRITTDNKTNEGLLYVKKRLDYIDGPKRNLTISVENEMPFHSCRVVRRSTTGLWEVITVIEETQTEVKRRTTLQVIVIVEDVNERPYFEKPYKQIKVVENVKVGQYLWTFTAKDPDITSGTIIVYRKGDEPAGWVTVDSKTGIITTTKIIDRESSFVQNNIYTLTIYAIDNGRPPMTGTATLTIYITDENDNAPSLLVTKIYMCELDRPSLANITAVDPDEDPNSGPFTFMLQGNQKGKWRLESTHGYSVYLVKESTVHSGHYDLLLEVSDRQGKSAVRTLSVTVCDCVDPAKPYCPEATSVVGGGALGVIFFSILLLAGLLLMAFLMSCKKGTRPIQIPDSGQNLMTSNIERQGTDCKVAFELLDKGSIQNEKQIQKISQVPQVGQADQVEEHVITHSEILKQQKDCLDLTWGGHSKFSEDQVTGVRRTMLLEQLNEKLYTLEAPEEELGDYAPHVYAEEGDSETNYQLDAISIHETPFDPDLDLDWKFSTLASICMPSESTAYSTIRHEKATLIQNVHAVVIKE
ncbi:cadherin-like protein 26 [Plectropomus leopardus]|uniref:cadherin-like protein 26 n=1 Tax=Plectropomus leopardus TaxID=160734 RepID=UPI001C4D3CDD|nr:cadherin-like protein 26 [Plectropomus leopardus]